MEIVFGIINKIKNTRFASRTSTNNEIHNIVYTYGFGNYNFVLGKWRIQVYPTPGAYDDKYRVFVVSPSGYSKYYSLSLNDYEQLRNIALAVINKRKIEEERERTKIFEKELEAFILE